ncbi:MAG TPA: phosphoglycolate phosphatase [Thauera sp.]|uniref:phosphoglycolate phosphatase n=1 Tax=Thauera sp. TaxID=1905334 RepID=UPI002B5194F7|nr:phosphoglycolate phosphatase [Thauera sp.]HRP25118.1 phosphoglycolate phosphatase [Thauera sp.]HRP67426.1 phosphoglycolate phosphatase [Thauera sp.]
MSVTARFSPRAVLFDLDGTLLDTIADLADAANLMLSELGRPARSQDEIHSFVGKGIPNLVRRCMTEGTAATEAEIDAAVAVFRRHYAVVNGVSSRPYPGVTELLAALRARELPLAVVTNKAEAFTLPLLERMDIAHYFDTVVSGDTLAVKKPDPAVVLLACERLGVAPGEALMIGDSANDALAAQGAGMPVLLVTYGYSEGVPVDTIECDGLLSNALQALDHIGSA